MTHGSRLPVRLVAIVIAGLLAAFVAIEIHQSNASAVTYTGPIVISQGGTYSGNWESTNTNPAVVVTTSAPVVIENCAVKGKGNLIQVNAVADLTVRNCYGEGTWAGTDGQGRMVRADSGVKNLIFENNEIVKAAAIKVQSARPASIKIRFNRATDIMGDPTNCCGGGFMQFVQLSNVVGPNIEIAWNEVVNRPGQSRTEDLISLFGGTSGASSASPLRIHDNFLWGSYPIPATSGGPGAANFSGGGIMVGDAGSRFVVVENNQVVATTNYGISIICGSDNIVRNNRVIAANRLANGQWMASANVGLSFWQFQCNDEYARNTMSGNVAGWMRGPNSRWGAGRSDWWTPSAGGSNVFSGNVPLDHDPTVADEQAEYTRWKTKSASTTIGRVAGTPTTAAPTTTAPAPTTTQAPATTTTAAPTTTTTAPATTTTTAPSTTTTAVPGTTTTTAPSTTTTAPPSTTTPTDPNANRPRGRISSSSYSVALSSLSPSYQVNNLNRNRSSDGNLLRLGGKTYPSGIGVHTESTLRYTLDGNYTRFSSVIGVDDEVGSRGTVRFEVYVDGVLRYLSPVMTGDSRPIAIKVDLTGARSMQIMVSSAGDGTSRDHGDWADARLIRIR